MSVVRVAVIGSGFIGTAHIETLKRLNHAEVVAVAGVDQAEADAAAAKYHIPRAYGNWQQILTDPDIDIVHNCTPNNLHFSINKALLEGGKHVLSEKPLCLNAAEAAELTALAAEKGLVNAINFNYRFYPIIQHCRELVARGDLGPIHLIHGHYIQDWLLKETDYNWRLETEMAGESRAMADIGSHWCDLVQFITGSKITHVNANLFTGHKTRLKPIHETETFQQSGEVPATPVDIHTEDGGTVMLKFDNGAIGSVVVSQMGAGRKNHLEFEIDGSQSAISWNQENPNNLWIGHRDRPNELLIKDPALLAGDAAGYAHYPGGHPEGYPDAIKNLFSNVCQFILDGKNPLEDPTNFPTFAEGTLENQITEAILQSDQKQQWVEV